MKHRDVLIMTILACACGSRGDQASTVSPVLEAVRAAAARASALNTPDPIARGVPHGGVIRELAVAEEGDAAITSDEINGIRLWPSLDGTRPPVPVASSSQAEQLALFHDSRDLVAAVLDSAGTVSLIRLGRDGSVRGRAQLPGDATYLEVVAVGAQVLARTDDHAIDLYSADAELLGRIMPGHGERVTDIAARRGRAAAVITTDDGTFVRWITAGAELRWEVSMKLPLVPRDNMLAIAPGKRRIAFVDTGNTGLHVLDLELIPLPVKGTVLAVNDGHTALGFSDDDTAIVAGAPSMWWTRDKTASTDTPRDPWAVAPMPSHTTPGLGGFAAAIGDRYLIIPVGLSLALMDSTSTRYLGWKQSAASSSFTAFSEHVVLSTSSSQFTWLDNSLALTRSFNLQDHRQPNEPWMYGTPIGSRHALAQHSDEEAAFIELIDADKPTERVSIGRFPRYDRHEYANGMLAVSAGRKVRRFQIDLEATRATEMRPALKLPTDSISWMRLFDPEKADGLVGIAAGWEHEYSDYQTAWVFRMVGSRIKTTKIKAFDHTLIRTDATGRMILFDSKGPAIVTMRGGTVESRTEIADLTFPDAANADATRLATKIGHEVVMRDGTGRELWRTPLWGASQVGFIAGDTRIVVAAPGGLVALDVATGAQVARECAWSFGLHDTQPAAMPVNIATVCEDPVVQ